jgi:hypothetical protein
MLISFATACVISAVYDCQDKQQLVIVDFDLRNHVRMGVA